MDKHQNLYKNQYTDNARQNRRNRELLVANRSKQRRDRFQDARNISPSPTRHRKEIIASVCPEGVENTNSANDQNLNNTRLVKIVCSASNPEILTRQEAFIKRFIKWREEKKKIKETHKSSFASAVSSCRKTTTSSSLVPRGHHKDFHPPLGLNIPLDSDKVEMKKGAVVKAIQAMYTVVPTPPRKQRIANIKNGIPKDKQNFTQNLHIKTANEKKNINSSRTAKPPPEKVKSKEEKNCVSVSKLKTKNVEVNLEDTLKKSNSTARPILRNDIKPRALKMPLPPAKIRTVTGGNNNREPLVKMRPVAQKRTEKVKETKSSPLKCKEALLKKKFKANKPLNDTKNMNVKKLNLLKSQLIESVVQTPIDFTTLSHFDSFVTSTKIKNSSEINENKDDITGRSSAKRNIMNEIVSVTLKKKSDHSEKKITEECSLEKVIKKHNFIRYSEITSSDPGDNNDLITNKKVDSEKDKTADQTDSTPVQVRSLPKCGPEERPANYLSPFVSVSRGKVSLTKEKEKRNSVYLKNADMRLNQSNDLLTERTSQNVTPENSVENRRTLEAVLYFRKQLEDEIYRLHELCDVWELYKKENIEKIQNACGEDMINVTIGQTRLLTSKKFMQFKGLIDRCEAGVTGIGAVVYDGSEGTKPITAVDLEGFWSMLGLQVDNLDKRFENLNRWKLNDWNDPDEVLPKSKKKLTKVKTSNSAPITKGKPNLALQQMVRKMQAEMRKNKNNEDINKLVILSSSKLNEKYLESSKTTTLRTPTDANTSRRLSIVVKDRKYFSPAATVISVSSPKLSSSKSRSSQDSPKILPHIQEFNKAMDFLERLDLRKSILLHEKSRRMSLNKRSPVISNQKNEVKTSLVTANVNNKENIVFSGETVKSPHQSPVATGRKSILKTPGTARSKLRNVIFNEKLRVKKFNFLINEDSHQLDAESGNDTLEEELIKSFDDETQNNAISERTINLRNRKVRLRPSSEIVIPKK